MSAKQCDDMLEENDVTERSTPSEKPLSKLDELLVVAYLEDASVGRPSHFKAGEKELKWYRLYNSYWLTIPLYIAVLVDLLIVVFERPALPEIEAPYWATMIIEIACLAYFAFRIYHGSLFVIDRGKYWRDPKIIVVVVMIALTVLDMLIYIILVNTCCSDSAIRITRALRPIFIINFSDFRQIRKAFRNIRKTLPDIFTVLILVFLTIAMFALLALEMFKNRSLKDAGNRGYFRNYGDAFFNLYVLMTSANNPDVMMPAYNENGWYALFFIAYVCISMYIFMSIFLAVVYSNYRKHLKKEVKRSVRRKLESIRKAFKLLRTRAVANRDQWIVTQERCEVILKRLKPRWSDAQRLLLWQVLDENAQGYIEKTSFYHIVDYLHVEIVEVKEDDVCWERCCSTLYNSQASQVVCDIVKHTAFRIVFDVIIVTNAIFIGLDLSAGVEEIGEAIFLVLFDFEILLKFYAWGIKGFFRRLWNVFDLLIMGAATVALLVEVGAVAADETWRPSRATLDIFMVLRVLRLIKIVGSINRFKVVINTILQIGPAITTYGAIMLVFYYFFAVIGMEAFGGRITFYPMDGVGTNATNSTSSPLGVLPTMTTYSASVPPAYENSTYIDFAMTCGGHDGLRNSDFSELLYCKNNFNHFGRALVVLFDLTVVNQWHIIAEGFVLMTHWSARIYFLCFHLICVILVLNIFVAFILEAFMLQYDSTVSKFETAVEKKIGELGVGVGMNPQAKKSSDRNHLIGGDDVGTGQVAVTLTRINNADSVEVRHETVQELADQQSLRFRILKKIQNAEILLQKMFEDELGDVVGSEEMGDKAEEEDDASSDVDEGEEFEHELGVGEFYTKRRESIRSRSGTLPKDT